MTQPHVSICIPVRNGMPFLAQTIQAALDQSGVDHEVVVRDNASTDGTTEFLRGLDHPRLRVVFGDESLSLPDNFRAVTEAARGDLVKLLCADDLIRPDACARQAAVLADPTVALVASKRDMIDHAGKVLLPRQGLRALRGRHTGNQVLRTVMLLGFNPIGEPGGVMFRREDYLRVGGWDGKWVYPMDLDLWLKLLAFGDLVGQPESLAAFRLSPGSLSAARRTSQFVEHHNLISELGHNPRWEVPAWQRFVADLTSRLTWWLWTWRQEHLLRPQRARQ